MSDNDILASLELGSLCSIKDDFFITNNPNSYENLAESLRDQVQTCPGGGINGSMIHIYRNNTCP